MSMALEIITQIRILEEIRVMSDTAREEAVTAFHTLLQDCGLNDVGYEMYEKLLVWRKPTFIPDSGLGLPLVIDERVPPGIAAVASGGQEVARVVGLSSSPDAPSESESPAGKPLSSRPERRDPLPGFSPTFWLEGPSSSAEPETPSE
jgi:hypothetical protein